MCPVTHTKKAWHFFAFIGCFEVFDYLYLPITTSKAHAMRRERRRLTLGDNLKVSKFQSIQCTSYFAFSYSMVCITELCGFAHRRFISLQLIFFVIFRPAKIQKSKIITISMKKKLADQRRPYFLRKSARSAGESIRADTRDTRRLFVP